MKEKWGTQYPSPTQPHHFLPIATVLLSGKLAPAFPNLPIASHSSFQDPSEAKTK